MVGQVHPLPAVFSAVIQQNCYLPLQTWHAGLLNIVFKSGEETCSCQLNQCWADSVTGYLPQCKQLPPCLCCESQSGTVFYSEGKNWQLYSQESLG